MLEIKNIHKSFGEQVVLQGIDMAFEQGKIHTIVGGNGSGKTTLFNLITGFLSPDKGQINLKGKRIDKHSPVSINKKGITRTFQDLRIITGLSVKENILLAFKNNPGENILNSILPSRIFKDQYQNISRQAAQIIEKVSLQSVENNLAGEISYGQQKLLTIGCCLANNADILLLDEPVAGIDKNNYQKIFELLEKLRAEGKTIIQIEHNHGFVESLGDDIWFLHAGKSYYFRDYQSFINDKIVKETYLN